MKITQELSQGRVLVLDGAMGTMLAQCRPGDTACLEEMNLSHPDAVATVSLRYAEAGADIVQTNSFGGSPSRLAAHGLAESAEIINREAVRIVRGAVPSRVRVAASCGPTGLPKGTPLEVIREQYDIQIGALLAEQPDMLVIETMTNLVEAQIALAAAKSIRSDFPVAVTMALSAASTGIQAFDGSTIEEITSSLLNSGADILGSNCGSGSDAIVATAKAFRKQTTTPLLMQPSAGIPQVKSGCLVYPESPEYMALRYQQMLRIGVNLIGGCCGTTPEHIAALRRIVDEFVIR